MENQHRKITGYRELSQTEIDLMNEVKELGAKIEDVLMRVQGHLEDQREKQHYTTKERHCNSTPDRFVALAKTEFQTGLMYATRAVAQPEFF